jgi:hypothetical protein
VKLSLLNAVRITVAALAAVLLFSGISSAVHPGYKVVTHPKESGAVGGFNAVEIATSTSSRAFGVFRVLAGAGLAGWVLWTFCPARIGKRSNQE